MTGNPLFEPGDYSFDNARDQGSGPPESRRAKVPADYKQAGHPDKKRDESRRHHAEEHPALSKPSPGGIPSFLLLDLSRGHL